jgi:hypothetical protein
VCYVNVDTLSMLFATDSVGAVEMIYSVFEEKCTEMLRAERNNILSRFGWEHVITHM